MNLIVTCFENFRQKGKLRNYGSKEIKKES